MVSQGNTGGQVMDTDDIQWFTRIFVLLITLDQESEEYGLIAQILSNIELELKTIDAKDIIASNSALTGAAHALAKYRINKILEHSRTTDVTQSYEDLRDHAVKLQGGT